MEVTIEYIRNLKKLYGPKAIDNEGGCYKKTENPVAIRSGNLSSRRTIGF